MGNTSTTNLISQVTVNEAMSSEYRGQALESAVLYPDYNTKEENAGLLSLVVAATRAIEMFCLLTGEKRKARYIPSSGVYLLAACHSPESILGNVIIVAQSNGAIVIFSSYSLSIMREFNSNVEIC